MTPNQKAAFNHAMTFARRKDYVRSSYWLGVAYSDQLLPKGLWEIVGATYQEPDYNAVMQAFDNELEKV